jgi:hypothetical protein
MDALRATTVPSLSDIKGRTVDGRHQERREACEDEENDADGLNHGLTMPDQPLKMGISDEKGRSQVSGTRSSASWMRECGHVM